MRRICQSLWVLCWLLTTPALAASQDAQVIDLQVSMPSAGAFTALDIEVTRLGSKHTVRLQDDGGVPNDLPHDGIWNGRLTGEYSRTVSVRVFGHQSSGSPQLLYSGVERTEDRRHVMLGWRVGASSQGYSAVRTPLSYPGNVAEMFVALPLITGFGGGLFVLLYVGMLVRMRRPGSHEE